MAHDARVFWWGSGVFGKGQEMETKGIGPIDAGLLRGSESPMRRRLSAPIGAGSVSGGRVLGELLSVRGRQTVEIAGGSLKFLDPRVDELRAKVQLGRGEDLSPEVVLDSPAERGEVAITFGGSNLNLGGVADADGVDEQFEMRVAGLKGDQVLSFASGTNISDMVNAINMFTSQTGVEAALSGTTITLQSAEFGSTEFVSVYLIDGGNIVPQPTATIEGGFDAVWWDGMRLEDFGADVQGRINGAEAVGRGRTLGFSGERFSVALTLSATLFDAWSGPFSFEPFRIVGEGRPGGIQDFSSGRRVDRTA